MEHNDSPPPLLPIAPSTHTSFLSKVSSKFKRKVAAIWRPPDKSPSLPPSASPHLPSSHLHPSSSSPSSSSHPPPTSSSPVSPSSPAPPPLSRLIINQTDIDGSGTLPPPTLFIPPPSSPPPSSPPPLPPVLQTQKSSSFPLTSSTKRPGGTTPSALGSSFPLEKVADETSSSSSNSVPGKGGRRLKDHTGDSGGKRGSGSGGGSGGGMNGSYPILKTIKGALGSHSDVQPNDSSSSISNSGVMGSESLTVAVSGNVIPSSSGVHHGRSSSRVSKSTENGLDLPGSMGGIGGSSTLNVPQGVTSMMSLNGAALPKDVQNSKDSIWLDCMWDPLAAITSYGCCMALLELEVGSGGDLVVGDVSGWGGAGRLRSWKSGYVVTDTSLPHPPTALRAFYAENSGQPHLPCLAVAAGMTVYIYKNRSPLTKFELPPVEADVSENEVWTKMWPAVKAFGDIRKEVYTSITPTSTMGGQQPLFPESSSIQPSPTTHTPPAGGLLPAGVSETKVKEFHEKEQQARKAVNEGCVTLMELRDSGQVPLTNTSLELLGTELESEKVELVWNHGGGTVVIKPLITTLLPLKKSLEDEDAASLLVLGTEANMIYVTTWNGNQVFERFHMTSPVALLSVYGVYDTGYRIVVAGRDGAVYSLKGDACQRLVELEVQPVGLICFDKVVVIGCMNNMLYSYTMKGRKQFAIELPSSINAMEPFTLKSKNVKGYLVALDSKEVRLYNGKDLISTIKTEFPVTAMTFGLYNRDPCTLVMSTRNGGLCVKILKRTASLDMFEAPSPTTPVGPPKEQDIPIPVPKKTKLYVDQLERERFSAPEMHRAFQRDLFKLRVEAARNFVKSLTNAMDPVSGAGGLLIKLEIDIHGLGPLFNLKLQIQNIGAQNATGLTIIVNHNPQVYKVSPSVIKLPFVIPGVKLSANCRLTHQETSPVLSDDVDVVVVGPTGTGGVVIATKVSIPVSQGGWIEGSE